MVTHFSDHVAAQFHIALHLFAAQIQVAIFQTKVFINVFVAVDLERHLLALALYVDGVDVQLDFTGFQLVIDRCLVARTNLTGDRNNALQLDALQQFVVWITFQNNALRDAVMVAQVDK